MPLTTAQINNELRPGLDEVLGPYETYKDEWKEIFQIRASKMAVERISQPRLLGLAQPIEEGQQIPDDDGMGDRYLSSFAHKKYGLRFMITEEAQDDNLYETSFPQDTLALRNSMSTTKNIVTASILSGGFAGGIPIYDGQQLFSAAHPSDVGVQSNLMNMDLNEAGLNAAMIMAAAFRDEAGIPVKGLLEKLIIGPSNWFVAERLMKSEYRVDTGNNDINPIKSTGLLPKGYAINHFINTIPDARPYYILTNVPGMVLYQRKKLQYDMRQEPNIYSISVSARERYSAGCYDWRSILGFSG